MAFIVGTDARDTKEIGQGVVVSGFSRDIYVNSSEQAVTKYDPTDPTSAWKRVKFADTFQSTIDSSPIKVYDGRATDHSIAGREEASLEVSQQYISYHESLEQYKGLQCFWMEAIGDDREPTDDITGLKIYQEMRIYDGTLDTFTFDKPSDGVYSLTGSGTFNTATVKKIFRKLTPMSVTGTPDGGNTASIASGAKTINVTALDVYGDSVSLDSTSNPEILSIQVSKVSGPDFTQGGTFAAPTLTYATTGTSIVKIVATSKNNVVVESAEITITVSA